MAQGEERRRERCLENVRGMRRFLGTTLCHDTPNTEHRTPNTGPIWPDWSRFQSRPKIAKLTDQSD